MINRIQDIQGFLRMALKPLIEPGDVVLDLTAGRGRDTLFLAECVGNKGHVYAFDIQESALLETARLLKEYGVADRVSLHQTDHALLTEVVQVSVRAVVFNLGYLPGSDHTVVTTPESTLTALKKALSLLKAGGLILLTVYRGHTGGLEEARVLRDYLCTLSRTTYCVLEGEYLNQGETAPFWIMIQRNKGDIG